MVVIGCLLESVCICCSHTIKLSSLVPPSLQMAAVKGMNSRGQAPCALKLRSLKNWVIVSDNLHTPTNRTKAFFYSSGWSWNANAWTNASSWDWDVSIGLAPNPKIHSERWSLHLEWTGPVLVCLQCKNVTIDLELRGTEPFQGVRMSQKPTHSRKNVSSKRQSARVPSWKNQALGHMDHGLCWLEAFDSPPDPPQ